MFHIYRKNVPFLIQIAWSCSHSVTIWNEIENKSHFHICCQSSFKRWSWVNLPVHFLKNIPVNKILFAMESNSCGLSHGAQLVPMWPCSLPGFKRLAWRIKCFKLSLSKDICRYLTEEKDESLGEELHNIFLKRNQNLSVLVLICSTEGTWRNHVGKLLLIFSNLITSLHLLYLLWEKRWILPSVFLYVTQKMQSCFSKQKEYHKKGSAFSLISSEGLAPVVQHSCSLPQDSRASWKVSGPRSSTTHNYGEQGTKTLAKHQGYVEANVIGLVSGLP